MLVVCSEKWHHANMEPHYKRVINFTVGRKWQITFLQHEMHAICRKCLLHNYAMYSYYVKNITIILIHIIAKIIIILCDTRKMAQYPCFKGKSFRNYKCCGCTKCMCTAAVGYAQLIGYNILL